MSLFVRSVAMRFSKITILLFVRLNLLALYGWNNNSDMAVDDPVIIAGGLDAIDDQVVLYNQGLIIGLPDLDANNNL